MEKGNNKTLIRFLRVLSYLLVAVAASCLTLVFFARPTKLEQLEKVISRRFIGQVDETAMGDAAAAAMISSLGDRWSYYIPADEYASHMERKANSFVGVGISVTQREDGTGFDIIQVEPDGPAQEAGILPGDILIAVDGTSIAGMDIDTPGQMIRGEAGTEVILTVLRNGETLQLPMNRQWIMTQVAEGQLLPDNTGYIRISNFNSNCAAHTIAAVKALTEQGAERLVFDVRNNPGGYVAELVELLDYLLPEGLLFHSVDSSGREEDYYSDAACIELPMAVLVNSESYSAAEFFAAALEEYDWAVIAGTPTVGKSYFQNTIRLYDGSAVGLSTGQYFTPKGVKLAEEGGLVPEILVEVDTETAALIYSQMLEPEKDPQLQEAIAAILPKNP